MKIEEIENKLAEKVRLWRKSPVAFIKEMWGLIPQPLKPEYQLLIKAVDPKEIKQDWFEPFVKGEHITWQQYAILLAVERALEGKAVKRISIASGHGIGKSATISWLLLWYLLCFKNSQVPCTAPSSDQLFDVLWKEVSLWMQRMPKPFGDLYEWQSSHIRMKASPEIWFARAKTARKEAPEALAGIHADNVLTLVDEASGVPEEIYTTGEGALTSGDILVILISNYTRLIGYFHDTHTKDKANWQTLQFSSLESPIVDKAYNQRIIDKYGEDSDEYRVRVLGLAPNRDAVDDKGYSPMFAEKDIVEVNEPPEFKFAPRARLGVDPAGGGKDTADWVIRDKFRTKMVLQEKVSTAKSIAQKTISVMELFGIHPDDVTVDDFGIGAKVVQELALARIVVKEGETPIPVVVNGVNVGDVAEDPERYINIRAEAFSRGKEWVRTGGEFIKHKNWGELLTIRERPNIRGKVQIMPKLEMKKEGYKSPNTADAWMLTFVDEDNYYPSEQYQPPQSPQDEHRVFNKL